MTAKDAAFGVWGLWHSCSDRGQGRQVTHTPIRASLASLAPLLYHRERVRPQTRGDFLEDASMGAIIGGLIAIVIMFIVGLIVINLLFITIGFIGALLGWGKDE